MDSKGNPTGFGGVFPDQVRPFIGFEQFEFEENEQTLSPAYPISMISIY
jgi:hypothetical protein